MKKICAPARGLTAEHSVHRRPLAIFDCPALLIEPDRKDRRDDHEARKGWKQDVVPSQREHHPDKDNRNDEHREPIGQAEAGPYHEVAPACREPAERRSHRQVALELGISCLLDARYFA